MGKLRYYGCFCETFSARARPLLDLLKKDTPVVWGPEQATAFDDVRAEIAKPDKALLEAL